MSDLLTLQDVLHYCGLRGFDQHVYKSDTGTWSYAGQPLSNVVIEWETFWHDAICDERIHVVCITALSAWETLINGVAVLR